jgi:hypothetical protein
MLAVSRKFTEFCSTNGLGVVPASYYSVLLTPDYCAAFISVLHLYETFGWSRKADYIKVHFAESMNEFHHLLIMEVCS